MEARALLEDPLLISAAPLLAVNGLDVCMIWGFPEGLALEEEGFEKEEAMREGGWGADGEPGWFTECMDLLREMAADLGETGHAAAAAAPEARPKCPGRVWAGGALAEFRLLKPASAGSVPPPLLGLV